MKLATALKNANRISDRLKSVGGIVSTPLCDFPGVKITRMWVFGSTVKGSQKPNDLDLLIEIKVIGNYRSWHESRAVRSRVRLDKRRARRTGFRGAIAAENEALKWLTKGTLNTSRHMYGVERIEIDKKVMIYPRNDLKTMVERGEL